MDIRIPEGYVPGSGAGKFSLGMTPSPDPDFHSAVQVPWLVGCRIALLLALFLWSRQSGARPVETP